MRTIAILLFSLLMAPPRQTVYTNTPDEPALHAELDVDCGVERWAVKTLSDPDTLMVHPENSVRSTVTVIDLLPQTPITGSTPRLGVERQAVEVDALLFGWKLEDDGDVHLLLRDPVTDSTMVAESPDPDCPEILATSRLDSFRIVRLWITRNCIGLKAGGFTYPAIPVPITVRGVIFQDFGHGQKAMAANNLEIHPVLFIEAQTSAVQPQSAPPSPINLTHAGEGPP